MSSEKKPCDGHCGHWHEERGCLEGHGRWYVGDCEDFITLEEGEEWYSDMEEEAI